VLGNEGGGCEKNEIYRMRILRMICGKTVRDRERNEEIRERQGG